MYTSCLKWVQPITSKLMDGQAKPAMPMCRSLPPRLDSSADAQVRNVACPMDKDTAPDGFILSYVNEGGSDFDCTWSGPNGYTSTDSWIFDLAPGVYTADITTTCGTQFTIERTVAAPEAWSVSTTVTEASCEEASDGVIEIEVEGASDPYTLRGQAPMSSPLSSRTLTACHRVPTSWITDANGCALPVTAFVPEVEPSDFTIGNDTIICEDEPLLIYGPLGYDYEWQDGSNNQFFYVSPGDFAPGTYNIVLSGTTDSSCEFADA